MQLNKVTQWRLGKIRSIVPRKKLEAWKEECARRHETDYQRCMRRVYLMRHREDYFSDWHMSIRAASSVTLQRQMRRFDGHLMSMVEDMLISQEAHERRFNVKMCLIGINKAREQLRRLGKIACKSMKRWDDIQRTYINVEASCQLIFSLDQFYSRRSIKS